MDSSAELSSYLNQAGIEPAASAVYLALITIGPASALQLAKKTKISRTQIYRHIETLQNASLVSTEQLSYGTLFKALPLQNLESRFADQEAQLNSLKSELNAMTTLLQQFAGSNGAQARVQHHFGIAGLKQANWNLTKAKTEFRVFESAHISAHLDHTFARRLRERIIERNLYSYDLTNVKTVKAADIEPFAPGRSHYKHIDPQILAITFEMYVYDHTVALLDYNPHSMQAIEINHPALSTMMTQLFSAMWNLAQPIEISGR